MSKAFPVSLLILVGLVALLAVGLVVAILITDDGIEGFSDDPAAYRVAQEAYKMAWVHRDNPIQRVLTPAARVVLVARLAGHCTSPNGWSGTRSLPNDRSSVPAIGPRPDSPFTDVEREYISQVRFYTFFGYPVANVFLTCGNSSASSFKPPKWK